MNELSQQSNWGTEAEQRVWKAVDELEEVINLFNNTQGQRDEARRARLASIIRNLLAEKYGIGSSTEEEAEPK